MKMIRLDEEATKDLLENGWAVTVGIYVIYKDGPGWDWAINPDDVESYYPGIDELADVIDFNADKTEVVDAEDYIDVDDEENEEDEE